MRPSEAAAINQLRDIWGDPTILHCGWPDFLVVTDNGTHAVEVKYADDLSKDQRLMFPELQLAGIDVYVARMEMFGEQGRIAAMEGPSDVYRKCLGIHNYSALEYETNSGSVSSAGTMSDWRKLGIVQ